MTIWLDIETAPKDGTRILCFGVGPCVNSEIYTGCFNTLYETWEASPNESSEYDPETCKPTHWMPLPNAPASRDVGEAGATLESAAPAA